MPVIHCFRRCYLPNAYVAKMSVLKCLLTKYLSSKLSLSHQGNSAACSSAASKDDVLSRLGTSSRATDIKVTKSYHGSFPDWVSYGGEKKRRSRLFLNFFVTFPNAFVVFCPKIICFELLFLAFQEKTKRWKKIVSPAKCLSDKLSFGQAVFDQKT